jgi:hypothetical protein
MFTKVCSKIEAASAFFAVVVVVVGSFGDLIFQIHVPLRSDGVSSSFIGTFASQPAFRINGHPTIG